MADDSLQEQMCGLLRAAVSALEAGEFRQARANVRAAGNLTTDKLTPHQRAAILHTKAQIDLTTGHIERAGRRLAKALRLAEDSLEPNHPEIGAITADLAVHRLTVERWKEAEDYSARAISILEAHPGAFATKCADALFVQGQLRIYFSDPGEAEAVGTRALAFAQSIPGNPIGVMGPALLLIGSTFSFRDNKRQAEDTFKQCLRLANQQSPPNRQIKTAAYILLAKVYRDTQNRDSMRRVVYRLWRWARCGKWRTPFVLSTCLELLSKDFLKGNKPHRAVQLAQRAVRIAERLYGNQHDSFGDCLDELGEAQFAIGDYLGAENSYRRFLEIRVKSYGHFWIHHNVLLTNLAIIALRLGKMEEASQLFCECAALCELQFGPTDPKTSTARQRWIRHLRELGREGEAKSMERYQAACEHPETGQRQSMLTTAWDQMRNDANDAWAQRDFQRVETLMRGAVVVAKQQEVLDINQAKALLGAALACLQQKNASEAEQLLRRALAVYDQLVAFDDAEASYVAELLAFVLIDRGDYLQAEPLLRRAWEGGFKHQKDNRRRMERLVTERLDLLLRLERFAEALEFGQRVLVEYAKDSDSDLADRLQQILEYLAALAELSKPT